MTIALLFIFPLMCSAGLRGSYNVRIRLSLVEIHRSRIVKTQKFLQVLFTFAISKMIKLVNDNIFINIFRNFNVFKGMSLAELHKVTRKQCHLRDL